MVAPTVYLKSITLRGFKSFADPTTLEFEPGVTVVVGPNGSGKSNVVDAVAWVLGAQGPRVVRSSKMDDVIFAGTAKRPALGRAEVSLTIDNSARRLPTDLAEMTITRTLFRTGESEYSMNGAPCRLLDIQELLSDAGVGRQQHVIMGQGQLDAILQARPEDRRAVIEEAAGILKFRRRRERAERRIEATESNLVRLQDLQREVRRQLRPLERQAEAARRHDALAAEMRALGLFLAGRELSSLRRRFGEADDAARRLLADEERLRAELSRLDEAILAGETALSAEQSDDVVAVLGTAERLKERSRGLANLITERHRAVISSLAAQADAGVIAALEAESSRLAGALAAAGAAAEALSPEWHQLTVLEEELRRDEEGWLEANPSRPDTGAERALLRRARDRAREDLAACREMLARSSERQAALARQEEELVAMRSFDEQAGEGLHSEVSRLRVELERAEQTERLAAGAVLAAENRSRQASDRAHALAGRLDALQLALDEAHARAGLGALASRPGVLGTLLDLVEIDDGCELAFEAALEEPLGAVVVEDPATARSAIEHLREQQAGGAVLFLPGSVGGRGRASARPESDRVTTHSGTDGTGGRAIPPGGERLRSRVRSTRPGVEPLLDRLLEGVILCRGGLGEALERASAAEGGDAGSVIVTLEGDRFSARGWRIGTGRIGATRAALEATKSETAGARAEAVAAEGAAEDARRRHVEARTAVRQAGRAFEAAAAEQRQAAGRLEETSRRLGLLEDEIGALEHTTLAAAEEARRLGEILALREAEVAEADLFEQEEAAVAKAGAEARRRLDERARSLAARRADLGVRSAGLEERKALLATRQQEVEGQLAGHQAARMQAAARRTTEERAARALERLAAEAATLSISLDEALVCLRGRRGRHQEAVGEISGALTAARSARAGAERELAGVRDAAQRNELERAEARVRMENAVEMLRHELDADLEQVTAAVCPELPPGIPPAARARELERELRLLGPVNPLAVEELAALEERDRFLSSQLEDVRSARRELSRVVKAVDAEIVNVFTEAFADVSQHFESLFATLFPGGSGRLSLVDPTDLLSSGVEIEARPAGRNVRRLSLLSGGERSLAALAYLFAVFRSRPSPFYLMDEVEAALDDVNLHRFLDLVDEFRAEAQLVLVTHQKRTMEAADVIYGVTLQPGGASKVVSERLRSDSARSA
jgi:chromosome segregation protein